MCQKLVTNSACEGFKLATIFVWFDQIRSPRGQVDSDINDFHSLRT